MKKYYSLVLVICLCLLFTGCKEKLDVTKCSSISKQSNYTIKTTYKIESRKDIVEKVSINQIISSGDKNILNEFKNQLEEQYGSNKSLYGSYDYDVKIKNNTIVSKVIIDYKKLDMKKFVENNGAMKDYLNKDNEFTLGKAKKLYISTGNKCETKNNKSLQ